MPLQSGREYRGGTIPVVTGCHFDDCRWQFEDAAERTLVFLRAMFHGLGTGGRQLVESTLNQIRTPPISLTAVADCNVEADE